ncbi:hypothetical protein OYT1_ch1102 [Ferriphaselus amnicola]|uniref:Uncharacterized protein n=1 Tax=Ferriphaselus amnicola TaxID=1188319 RepID=A0A2Z6GBA7_9PROT|nr:hypothetical protein [Ferriphaselus amnicola]BBE50662.1 hypothetical protein OYT1_ch1102 [Ferriphaselus amnicola]
MTDRDLLREQWQTVAHALKIEFVGPFMFPLKNGHYEFACLLPQFGSERGMLIDVEYVRDAFAEAISAGFACSSMLAEEHHLPIDPADYINCLVDWGWSAKEPPPEWYHNAT